MLRRMAMKEWVWSCGAPGEGGLVLLTTEAASSLPACVVLELGHLGNHGDGHRSALPAS